MNSVAFMTRVIDFISVFFVIPESEYKVEDHTIPVESVDILVRCVTPNPSEEGNQGPYPLLIWYHGGGNILSRGLNLIQVLNDHVDFDDHILRALTD